ncbi:hypothetical protein LY474_33090 [Myxococcus stipitatus]|uniref:hypothetical protein n=1 Tax=Myxococcus stipitatus TaxID=83455 RepID=UPI001F1974BE|nr:hypothetical protein [Myxococcus stipitatus]MCE9672655.1 hypothetical protein [Myxococcus stipitatus]
MHARRWVWLGTLLLSLVLAACDDKDHDQGLPSSDSGTDAGVDGGLQDGGLTCNVARQEGCGAGESCHFANLPGGGTGSRCFAAECDVVKQDCAGGLRCTYVGDGDTTTRRCVEEGTGVEGAHCTLAPSDAGLEYDTCAAGLFCKDEHPGDGGTVFACRRLCHASTQCSGTEACNTVVRLAGTTELPLLCGARSQPCDPFASACAAPLSCYPSASGPVCAGSGTRGTGASCDFSNQCAPGSACVSTGAGLTCRPLCRPGGTPACSTGTCRPLSGNTGVGACIP